MLEFSNANLRKSLWDQSPVLGASRFKIGDHEGVTRAALGMTRAESPTPQLAFQNSGGKASVWLDVNTRGYKTMDFQRDQTEGKVSVGYLRGSDTVGGPKPEDPRALGAFESEVPMVSRQLLVLENGKRIQSLP